MVYMGLVDGPHGPVGWGVGGGGSGRRRMADGSGVAAEVAILKELTHENIVQLLDLFCISASVVRCGCGLVIK